MKKYVRRIEGPKLRARIDISKCLGSKKRKISIEMRGYHDENEVVSPPLKVAKKNAHGCQSMGDSRFCPSRPKRCSGGILPMLVVLSK